MMSDSIKKMLDDVDWVEVSHDGNPDGLYATHFGRLNFGHFEIKCYTLNNGQRILDSNDLEEFFSTKQTLK